MIEELKDNLPVLLERVAPGTVIYIVVFIGFPANINEEKITKFIVEDEGTIVHTNGSAYRVSYFIGDIIQRYNKHKNIVVCFNLNEVIEVLDLMQTEVTNQLKELKNNCINQLIELKSELS